MTLKNDIKELIEECCPESWLDCPTACPFANTTCQLKEILE